MAMNTNHEPSGMKGPTTYVPYRATKLWNEVVKVFREGLPVGRHRRHMKSYESCFIASEGVSWLHQRLMGNPNFGPQVTRTQTVQLLQKFQKAKFIVDVRGPKHEKAEFIDNGRLYRFTETSPMKTPGESKLPARTPLGMRSALMNSDSALTTKPPVKPKPELERGHSIACLTEEEVIKLQAPRTEALQRKNRSVLPKRSQSCRREREVVDNPAQDVQLTDTEINHIWKENTIDSLQTILQLKDIEEVLDPDLVNVKHVIHNMTQINKNGLVTNIDKKDQLPHWIISAMRCLAYWPEKVEENLPDYPGFENDVYKVIKDYFCALDEPLITHQLYEVFLSVMVYADNIGKPAYQQVHNNPHAAQSLPSTTSVENLLLNMTNQDNIGPDDILIFNDPDVTILPGCPTPHSATRTLPWGRTNVGVVYPQTRMETSFGVYTDEPLTRLYQKGSPQEDYSYHSTQEPESYNTRKQSESRTPKPGQRPYSVCTSEDLFSRSPMDLVNEYLKSQRYGSMGNVHEVGTYGGEGGMSGRINSWTSIQSGLHHEDQHLNGLSQRYHGQLPGAKRPLVDRSRPPPHPDLQPPPPPYTQDPPPYIPPPSYKSICTRPPPHPLGIQRRTSHSKLPQGNTIPQTFSSPEHEPSDMDLSRSLPSLEMNILAESYRQAIDCAGPTSTPIGRSLYGTSHRKLQRSNSSPSVLTPLSRNRVYDVLQLCCLLIPPANRRKLHLLLRFMNKASNNSRLMIDNSNAMRELVMKTFTRCILRSEDEVDHDEILTQQIVTFMVDGYIEIMKIPDALKTKVDEKIAETRRMKVTVAQYERQRMTSSQVALNNLLDGIVHNPTMTTRDKKRHLKQFQKNHPQIYNKRFPTSQSESELFAEKSKSKSQLLSKPLQKLKNLRL